jgi:hypothetical protein
LVGRLAPDFKTLAGFRAENAAAIKNVCREFIVLCRSRGLFTEATVVIDGSKFKAVNHRDHNFTSGKMKTRMALIAGASLFCFAESAFAADATSAMVGTRKFDVNKTEWNGSPALKSYTITIADAGGGKLKDMAQWVNADGTTG